MDKEPDYMSELIALEKQQGDKNRVLLDEILKEKGQPFYDDLQEVIYESDGITGVAEFVSQPVGNYQEEGYDNIPGIWVNQTTNGGYTGDTFAGTVCVKINEEKYFKFHYSM